MSNASDIAALILRQGTAVGTMETTAAAMAAFLNNDANTPVSLPGGGTVPSLASLVSTAGNTAARRNYEISWSMDDLSAYGAGIANMFRVRATTDLTFANGLAGSYFYLDVGPSAGLNFVVQLKFGNAVIPLQWNSGQLVPTAPSTSGPIIVPAGTEIKAIIPGNLNGVKGLVMNLLGTTKVPTV